MLDRTKILETTSTPSRERGATAVEFGLTVGLIATFGIVAVTYFSDKLTAIYEAASAGF